MSERGGKREGEIKGANGYFLNDSRAMVTIIANGFNRRLESRNTGGNLRGCIKHAKNDEEPDEKDIKFFTVGLSSIKNKLYHT